MMAYLGDRLDFLNEKNKAVAEVFLREFPIEDVKMMQMGSVSNSET